MSVRARFTQQTQTTHRQLARNGRLEKGKKQMFSISHYKTDLDLIGTAVLVLEKAVEFFKAALPRCQNCGTVMDETVCPRCGYVQR